MVLHKSCLLLGILLFAGISAFAQKPIENIPPAEEGDDILVVEDDANGGVVPDSVMSPETPETDAFVDENDVFAVEDNDKAEEDMAEVEDFLASYDGDTAVSTEEYDTVVVKGVHPLKETSPVATELSMWSIYLAGGMNVFDGDYTSEKKHAFFAPTVSFGAAYHFTNTWALGLEYKYHHYKVFGAPGHASVLLDGRTHQGGGYITFDVFNCFRPQNKHKLFALDLILGGYAFWFKNDVFYENIYKDPSQLGADFKFRNVTSGQTPKSDDKFTCSAMFVGGASFEFNLNRSIQLGLRALYNYSTTDLVDGRPRGNNNDGIFDMEALIRYKIDAVDKSHTRNFRSKDALQAMNDEEPRMIGKDTIYIYRKDTLYIISDGGYGKMTNTMPGINTGAESKHAYYVVYFNNDSRALDNASKRIISEASQKMLQDYDLYALIVGSCDNTGTAQYNNWLAVSRSYNVAREMSLVNSVEMGRMHTVGKGIITDNNRRKGSYRPNRRVEIHLLTREEFEQAKQLYKNLEKNKEINKGDALKNKTSKSGQKTGQGEGQNTGSVTITVPDDVNVADGSHITVQKATSLQNLAQTHYKNSNCWIYLYLVNGDFISSPSYVAKGTTIILPQLTEKQLKITSAEAEKLRKQYVTKN